MPIMRALNHSGLSEETRARLTALRDAIHAESVETTVALLTSEADPFVRETALTHLARRDGAFPAAALVRLMRDSDTALRNAGIETLGSLGERALDALAALIGAGDVDQRIYALTALQLIECERAAELALSVALTDADVNVCAAAVDVVAASGVRGMGAALQRVAARFPDQPYLVFAADAAQRQLG